MTIVQPPMEDRPAHILPTIVGAQFAGTSLWFAGNAVVESLARELSLNSSIVSSLTSAVQFGFIAGTLLFAFTALTDRMPARLLFLLCCGLGATATATVPFAQDKWTLLALRFVTGFSLAGVYPVGMKIAASWFGGDLGKALGFLVGALVLGTAFPHALGAGLAQVDYRLVLWSVSGLALLGGVMLYVLVPEGPLSRRGARFDPAAFARMFARPRFRAAAFGYFGHMWELYAFWAFVPWVITRSQETSPWGIDVASASFMVIATGALGCVVGGLQSGRVGGARVAASQLSLSGLCCLGSPLLFVAPPPLAVVYLLVWGWSVVADSPQFSSLAAAGAPPEYLGSALTLMNCMGYGISIVTVEMLGWVTQTSWAHFGFLLLLPGPVLGVLAMRPFFRPQALEAQA